MRPGLPQCENNVKKNATNIVPQKHGSKGVIWLSNIFYYVINIYVANVS